MKFNQVICLTVKLTDGRVIYAVDAAFIHFDTIEFTDIYGKSRTAALHTIISMKVGIAEVRPPTSN